MIRWSNISGPVKASCGSHLHMRKSRYQEEPRIGQNKDFELFTATVLLGCPFQYLAVGLFLHYLFSHDAQSEINIILNMCISFQSTEA